MAIENTEDLQQAVDQIAADIQTLNNRITNVNQALTDGQFPTLTIQDNILRTADNGFIKYDAVNKTWRMINDDVNSIGRAGLFSGPLIQVVDDVVVGSNVATLVANSSSQAATLSCYKVTTPFKRNSGQMVGINVKGEGYGGGRYYKFNAYALNASNGLPHRAHSNQQAGDLVSSGMWAGYDGDDNLCFFFGHGVSKYIVALSVGFIFFRGEINNYPALANDFEISLLSADGKPPNTQGDWLIGSETYYAVTAVPEVA